MEAPIASLHAAAARGRPTAMADTRLLEVPRALAGFFPEEGIRRGATVGIDPARGGSSLALALIAAATRSGWAAAVGIPSLGLVAAGELGVHLDRLALVPRPGERWAAVVAALVDGFDMLLLSPPVRVGMTDARRLSARTRERGAVLVVLASGSVWPVAPDLHLSVVSSEWNGLRAGSGYLRERRVEVACRGRRAASRERRKALWLPGREGQAGPLAARPPGLAHEGDRRRPAMAG